MRIGIEKRETCISRTIEGKEVLTSVEYYVYRSYLFGLFRRYLWFSCPYGVKIAYEVRFEYTRRKGASSFRDEKCAIGVVEEIREHPEKFVRYVKK